MLTKSLILIKTKALADCTILGVFLALAVFPLPAQAGRYVFNQKPETLERYFGRPLSEQRYTEGKDIHVLYEYSTESLRQLFPELIKDVDFSIEFVNNQAKSISVPNNMNMSSATFAKFFTYIFDYQPSIWKPLPSPGHEGFREYKVCLGDGVLLSGADYGDNPGSPSDYSNFSYDPVCEPPY